VDIVVETGRERRAELGMATAVNDEAVQACATVRDAQQLHNAESNEYIKFK
jgi:hypothetical protein